MIEATLERIATALEQIAVNTRGQVVSGSDVVVTIDTATVTAGGAAAEPPKKARGRPAKITTEAKDTATTAEVVAKPEPVKPLVDDFLDTPVVLKEKPATLEDVRAALQAYAAKKGGGPEGTAKARTLMTDASSNKAQRLSIAKDVPGGDQFVLLPADYAAVIKAALA